MSEMAAHEMGVVLLSLSFGVALLAAGIVGKLGGFELGAAATLASVGVMSLAAAALTWQAGPQPDRGMVRVQGIVSEPAKPKDAAVQPDWNEASTRDAVIRFADASGGAHEIPAYELPQSARIGDRVMVDDPANGPEGARAVDPNFRRTMLLVFLLFGVVPLLMGLTVFAATRENHPGARRVASPRPAALAAACRYARIAANLALLYDFTSPSAATARIHCARLSDHRRRGRRAWNDRRARRDARKRRTDILRHRSRFHRLSAVRALDRNGATEGEST